MLEEIIGERKKKVDALREQGIDPYPASSRRTMTVAQALKEFSALAKSGKKVVLAGRIRSSRDQGKILFCDIEDETGKMQVVLRRDTLKTFPVWKKMLEAGDFAQVSGVLFKTATGQKSVDAKDVVMLTKALRPLPSEFYGIEDTELRLRKRYLDTLLHPDVKDLFVRKSKFWQAAREFLQGQDFLEVETPVLEATPGGAEAEPFVTHHNALDEDFYLRISLEISLKKMMVAGFERVFEIGRIFRNEGIDAEHLQDYTQLELYWAYADYNQLMKFVEKMFKFMIKRAFGTLKLSHGGKVIDWGGAWEVVDYCKAFKKKTGLDPVTATRDELFAKAQEIGLAPDKSLGRGRLIDLVYKKTVRPTLIKPSFLINPPVAIEPLAKRSAANPEIVERFQVVAYGTELGKGFSEANDPIDQRERFEEQMRLREKGDAEAQMLDEDFLEALEYGMPPTAGFGFSERLFAVLAQKPVREAVFFPPMKKRNS
jgi:lysyl-tRNA synthetase class 2